jgi:outer membrane lipoprotein SlyB
MNPAPDSSPAAASGNKALWVVVAVLGATVVAMGAYLLRGPTRPVESGATAVPALIVAPVPAAATPTPSPVLTEKKESIPVIEKKTAAVVKPVPTANKPVVGPTPTPAHSTAPAAPVAQMPQMPVPPAPVSRPVCLICGTVTSVTPIQREGVGSGTGAIAGGVIGGVLGNQVGGGDGKTLATILGAIGGGMAGNAVEKKMKKETVYEIEVRMDDGTKRNFEQATPASVGAKVVVEDGVMRPVN